jgi:site-specific recombinase XerD
MGYDIAVASDMPGVALTVELVHKVEQAVAASVAENTQRAYQSDLRMFTTWCEQQGLTALPATAATVAAYLSDLVATGKKVNTVRRHLATISKAHQLAGLDNPAHAELVKAVMHGLQREHGRTPDRATPLLAVDVRRILAGLQGVDTATLRDRALLLAGWHGALRRQELANLTWGNVTAQAGGLVLELRHTKTDKAGAGQHVGLACEQDTAVCPVHALQVWHAHLVEQGRGAPDMAVFPRVTKAGAALPVALTGQGVALVLARRAAAAGLQGVTGHSLRRGLVHEAHLQGVADSRVMAATRHKSVTMLRVYQGEAGLISQAPGKGLL